MDIEQARFNMIEQQIRPWDVLDPQVLSLLAAVRREDFVPPAYRSMAFMDMEVPLPDGQCMLAPRVEARLLQELQLQRHEHVLEVGAGSGFMAALLAYRTRQVTTLELSQTLVRMRTITPAEAAAYWDTGEPAGKAGAYAIQGLGAVFIEQINGSYSGVMGLPLYETARLLQSLAIPRP